ncbi:Na+/H+ antiporter NhaA [Desulfovibrio inopinatus]|uniref:Na+/H+ antiporter NhaA n=1 Tax=Desulfovibrio inopinatus TaxID=102109 RepID=UPI0003FE8E2E|nr:Na+/H+ antiporter NhaA [Desulfovibrio inopinatus]
MNKIGKKQTPDPDIVDQLLTPFINFFRVETSGGVITFICACIAIMWINSPWSASYTSFFHSDLSISFAEYSLSKPLLSWVNDGLMTIFFFMVGLEIKRSILVGELDSLQKASLPLAAAFGGMIIPAIIYSIFNVGMDSSGGWGIPMATDIGFALGILALLGNRVPPNLKVFLTAVAIVDDIGAVLVIKIFYTSQVSLIFLGLAGVCFFILLFLNAARVRRPLPYMLFACAMWFFFLNTGVHPSVAGVLSAMTVPARSKNNAAHFLNASKSYLQFYEKAFVPGTSQLTNQDQLSALNSLENACYAAETPLQRLEYNLHPWVAFFIIPIFALSNAGVTMPASIGSTLLEPVSLGIILGLVVGKPLGITLASLAIIRCGTTSLPTGLTIRHLIGGGCLAGIGFSISFLKAFLAFPEGSVFLEHAKLAILVASIIASGLGAAILAQK